MKLVQQTMVSPAENLACDEALLDVCEETGEEALRLWESPVSFVVVGYGNNIAAEVDAEACGKRGVPVLRRCSGGGTVVQGPGCLSYALCLRVPDEAGPLGNVAGTNRFVMERSRAAMAALLNREVAVLGHTDLALRFGEHWLKFSGNAQRRRRRAVLFHGTILYDFDLGVIAELLRFPSKQPDYRSDREHLEFITNVEASADAIGRALAKAWEAENAIDSFPEKKIQTLVSERYGTKEWNESR